MKQGWEYKKFETCINKVPKAKQVKTDEYNSGTRFPIISQEDKLISGYHDDESMLFHIDNPIVIFGDHTRVLKYIDFDFVVGADGVKIISPKDDLNAKFLLYYLTWYNIPNLGYSRHYKLLKELDIPLPPLSTQQSIVSELDKINELIRLKKEQLSDYDKLAQSLFYEMFGNPVENEKGWDLRNMEDLCTHIVDCPHSTPKKADYITNFPCIRTSELRGGTISWDSMQYLEEEEYLIRIARLKPEAGDIVFGREGTIGDAVILPDGYSFSLGQRTMLLRADSSIISNVYLHRVILSEWVKQQIDYVNVSSTVAHVNIKDFKKFTIPLPPLPLQQLFATRISSIEQQKANVKAAIEDLETLLASRMQYYFE